MLVAAIGLVVIPAYAALLIPLYDLSLGEYLRCVAAYEVCLLPIGGAGQFLIMRRFAGPLFDWVAGERDPQNAPAAWTAAVVRIPQSIVFTTFVFWLATCPASIWVGHYLAFPGFGYPVLIVALSTLVGAAGFFFFLVFDGAVRPVAREIADSLPRDFQGGRSLVSLGRRLTSSVPVISFITALAGACVAYDSLLGPEEYMLVMCLLAALASLLFGMLSTLVVRNAVLGRIADLGRAMKAVDAGDLDTHVPPLAGDEIDDLAANLNRMVEGLREREILREDLRGSRARLVASADSERRRMERSLRDGAEQRLMLAQLKLTQAERAVTDDPGASAQLAELRAEIERAGTELRDLAHGIYPAVLESDGLAGALSQAAGRSSMPVTVAAGSDRFPRPIEAAVYFCCLEALQNAGKHVGEGGSATVTLERDAEGGLLFSVTDDGPGFDPGAASGGRGLQNMRDRIGALGGRLLVDSSPGRGTAVTGQVPAR